MRLGDLKTQVSLKMALFTTATMAVLCVLILLIFSHLDIQMHGQATLLKAIAVVSALFLFFQAILSVLAVAIFVLKPLSKLQQSLQRVAEGNLILRLSETSQDEFGELSGTVNQMLTAMADRETLKRGTDQRLAAVEATLKARPDMEAKAKLIDKMNLELSEAFTDLSLLYRVSQNLNSVLEIDELIDTVKGIFSDHVKCDQFALLVVTKEGQHLRLATQRGLLLVGQAKEVYSVGVGMSGHVVREKKSLYLPDLSESSFEHQINEVEKRAHGSLFCTPLIVQNEAIGVMLIVRAEKDGFTPTDRQSLEAIVSQIAVAYDRSQLYGKTKELSVRDELTGAYNRRFFHQRLELELKRAERFKRPVSLLMIDVDHFKRFNDTYGHLKGDDVLKRLTHLIEHNIREIDLFARFGGEEFVVVLADTPIQDAVVVANKLRELIATQLDLGDVGEPARLTSLTVSIGVSAVPTIAKDHEELVNTADMALYMAKKNGRNQVYCYQSGSLPLDDVIAKMGFMVN
jgi:diguanylate cyclase (GGDEF)-like protein